MVRTALVVLSVLVFSTFVVLPCFARGGGGGGRGGAARSGAGAAPRAGGTIRGRSRTPTGRTTKELELLRDQEARMQMIRERRDRLMDLDRKKEQEAFLAANRRVAADLAARTEDIR